jgi:hypothetical protein
MQQWMIVQNAHQHPSALFSTFPLFRKLSSYQYRQYQLKYHYFMNFTSFTPSYNTNRIRDNYSSLRELRQWCHSIITTQTAMKTISLCANGKVHIVYIRSLFQWCQHHFVANFNCIYFLAFSRIPNYRTSVISVLNQENDSFYYSLGDFHTYLNLPY